MLDGAVQSAGIGDLLDDVLSVEDVQVFKPHKSVYDLVGKRFNCAPNEVLFVSSNGWDAAAAAGYGFYTTWVNRAGETDGSPALDTAAGTVRPHDNPGHSPIAIGRTEWQMNTHPKMRPTFWPL